DACGRRSSRARYCRSCARSQSRSAGGRRQRPFRPVQPHDRQPGRPDRASCSVSSPGGEITDDFAHPTAAEDPSMQRFALMAGQCWLPIALASTTGHAQNYPTKTVRIVVPYPAGGPTDLVGRRVADVLTKELKKPVIVENKSGAGGTIGTDAVAKSAHDGHTLLLGLMGPMSIPPKIVPNLPYDPLKDLAPVRLVAIMPELLVARPQIGLHTLAEV